MSSKKWLIMFFLSIVLVFALLAGLNMLVDPFGVFGDILFDWHSYNVTMNPRIAKIEYLDEHYKEYDSYIIGCSATSSFPVEELNAYYDASFYNMIMYGADMEDVELTVAYMLENYHVENLILSVYIDNGVYYSVGEDTLTNNLHEKISGKSKLNFYSKYLFLNPRYAISKIQSKITDTYLPQPFDVFDTETGAYDKRVRDVEPISALENYIEVYPVFGNYPEAEIQMAQIDSCMDSITAIRDMCKSAGIDLTVVNCPVYSEYMEYFEPGQIAEFYSKLAEITAYWEFSMSSVSFEPRYFYDGTHFRNAAGTMALARIFGNGEIYVPDDFGTYITKENASLHTDSFWTTPNIAEADYTADVPILMYHHLDDVGNDSTTVTADTFHAHIKALHDNGYTAISFDELISYVDSNSMLPEKPILITFDDGYLSNYEIAFPILEKYNMKATIFVIGSSVGKSFYKDTNHPIIPHFDYDQAKEMVDSGLISIQSHTYDMHQWQPFEDKIARTNILMFEGEDEYTYIDILRDDFLKSSKEIYNNTDTQTNVLAFPNGFHDTLSHAVLRELGVRATLSTSFGSNTVIKGLPQCLYAMRRFNMNQSISEIELLDIVGKKD